MIVADGHERPDGRRSFTQNEGETLDTFTMALTMLGESWNTGRKPDTRNCRHVGIRKGKNFCIKRAEREVRPYHKRVWCPVVADNKTWVARRNGKPFITHNSFYYFALGKMLQVAIKHPMRMAPYAALPFMMSSLIAAEYDVDEEDVERLKQALPGFVRERGNAYFLPWKDKHGRWQAVNIGYFFPWPCSPNSITRR